MRKILGGIIIACVVIIVGVFFAAPSFINYQITEKLQQKVQNDTVQTVIETSPRFMLLFGKIDNLNLSADNIQLGKVDLNNLAIKGSNIDLSMQDLLLARRLVINSADSLVIEGTIDENNLSKLLNEKIDQVSDIKASINDNDVEATGKISLFGRQSDIHVKGHLLLSDNNLIFRITNVDTSNSLIGRIGISFTKDIIVSSADSLPIENAQFTKVEQENGQILIVASVSK